MHSNVTDPAGLAILTGLAGLILVFAAFILLGKIICLGKSLAARFAFEPKLSQPEPAKPAVKPTAPVPAHSRAAAPAAPAVAGEVVAAISVALRLHGVSASDPAEVAAAIGVALALETGAVARAAQPAQYAAAPVWAAAGRLDAHAQRFAAQGRFSR